MNVERNCWYRHFKKILMAKIRVLKINFKKYIENTTWE